jgi:hypothetical protein
VLPKQRGVTGHGKKREMVTMKGIHEVCALSRNEQGQIVGHVGQSSADANLASVLGRQAECSVLFEMSSKSIKVVGGIEPPLQPVVWQIRVSDEVEIA